MAVTPKAIHLSILFIAFLIFTYKLQNLRFKGKLSEKNTSHVMWMASIIYMSLSIGLILALKINFVSGGFLNLLTVSYLLKAISYAHVLNEVRTTIDNLNNEDDEALESIPSYVT